MNIFRITGDLSHLLAIIILFFKIWKTRSCAGISGKSQILFVVVYISRYLDVATIYFSLYNTLMKIVYITASLVTVCLIYLKFKDTYDHKHDTFRMEFLIIASAILALLINHEFTLIEVFWTFSIYMEAVAILPQLNMVNKTAGDTMIYCYLFALFFYRLLYVANWLYRYVTAGYYDWIAFVAGIVQTILYATLIKFEPESEAELKNVDQIDKIDDSIYCSNKICK